MATRHAGLAGLLVFGLTFVGAVTTGPPTSRSPQAPALAPTSHPPVPLTLDGLWLAPDAAAQAAVPPPAVLAGLQEGARRCLENDYAEALPLLTDPAFAGSALAPYADFYAGRALLGLEQYAEAQQAFMAILDRNPAGYLAEAATIGAAEAAEGLDQPEVALRLYEGLIARKPLDPEMVWLKIGQMAEAIEDRRRAAEAFLHVYYEFPLSDEAADAATELNALKAEAGGPGTTATYARDLARAAALFDARRWADARAAYLDLRGRAGGDDRVLVDVRLATCDINRRRYRAASDRLRPIVGRDTAHRTEARYAYARALRGLGRSREFVAEVRNLVRDAPPGDPWAEAALDALGTHFIVMDEDAQAAAVFDELYERNPSGRYAERSAWKVGWWAYRHGEDDRATRYFESAAASFPRSNYRPQYLYWSGRARVRMGDRTGARERFALAVEDYGSSYYGRLAVQDLERLGGGEPQPAGGRDVTAARVEGPPAVPATAPTIRLLVAAELYEAALNELEYARRQWGSSPLIDASRALVLNRQGEFRRAITIMKQVCPQYLTAEGERLPVEVQRIFFPLDYWPLIQKYAGERNLDPYLIAALVAQESTFDAAVRSGANAYGLMQLVPATGRRVGRALGMRRVTTRSLVDPETNIRLGTAHFAELLRQFGELHLALAAYNAGDRSVIAWIRERPGLSAEEFIDDIPFPETQGYVRRILSTAVDYRRLYGASEVTTAR